MRRFIFGLISIARVNGTVDPCMFVGFRLGKIHSFCGADSICSGLTLDDHTNMVTPRVFNPANFHPLTCEEAGALSELISADSEMTIEMADIVDGIAAVIVPYVKGMLYRDEEITPSVRDSMSVIDNSLRTHLRDQSSWPEKRELIRSSTSYKSLVDLWLKTVDWSYNVPEAVDVFTGRTSQFAHFFFDLSSVIGPPDESLDPHAPSLTTVAIRHACEYRVRHDGELHFPLALSFTWPPDHLVLLSFFISSLRRNLQDPETIDHMTYFLSSLPLERPPTEAMTATEALIRYQMSTQVCPNLLQIVTGYSQIHSEKKAWANLIVICAESLPPRSRVMLHSSIQLGYPREDNMQEEYRWLLEYPTIDGLVHALLIPKFPWIFGLDIAIRHSAKFLASKVLEICEQIHTPIRHQPLVGVSWFATRDDFKTGTEFETVMRAYGRAIGFCIRANVPFGYLGATITLLQALHGRQENSVSGVLDVLESRSLDRQVFFDEPAFFIRRGIVDSIGPGGVFMFSADHWLGLIMGLH